MGGEEFGGLFLCGYIFEWDGLFNSFLMIEVVVVSGQSFDELFVEIECEVGFCYVYDCVDLYLSEVFDKLVLMQVVQGYWEVVGQVVIGIKIIDGVKLVFVGDVLVMFCVLGIELVVCVYVEV